MQAKIERDGSWQRQIEEEPNRDDDGFNDIGEDWRGRTPKNDKNNDKYDDTKRWIWIETKSIETNNDLEIHNMFLPVQKGMIERRS